MRAIRRLRTQLRPEMKYVNAADTAGVNFNAATADAVVVSYQPTIAQDSDRAGRMGDACRFVDFLLRGTFYYNGSDGAYPFVSIRIIYGVWKEESSTPVKEILSTSTGVATFWSGYDPQYRDMWRKISDRYYVLGTQGASAAWLNKTYYTKLSTTVRFANSADTSPNKGYPFMILVCDNITNMPYYKYSYRLRFTDV